MSTHNTRVVPQGFVGAAADWLMQPLMYVAQGTVWERPQRTHLWNNTKLKHHRLELESEGLVHCAGDPSASEALWFGLPRFHVPVLGGWRKFVALDVGNCSSWHIGWITDHGFVGVSRVPLVGPVRMTIGPGDSTFFALKHDGTQYRLRLIGEGLIGEAGEFRQLPLF